MGSRVPEQVVALIERASDGWRRQKSRMTAVRRIVCETAFAFTDPFHAEELLARSRAIDRLISPATVYRTLNQLVELGLLREVPSPGEHRFFSVVEAAGDGFSHVICKDCSQVIALPDPCLPLREGALARQHGFSPTSMLLRVEATCDELHQTGDCPRRREDRKG